MYLDRLMNQGSVPVLEQFAQFTDDRQNLLGEDIANVSTPNYVQKDLSLENSSRSCAERSRQENSAAPGQRSL